MKIAIIVFMVLVILISLVAVGLVLWDVIQDIKQKNKVKQNTLVQGNQLSQNICAPTIAQDSNIMPISDEAASIILHDGELTPAHEVASMLIPIENGVTFAVGANQTLRQKYAALPEIHREYFDQIAQYAALKQKATLYKTAQSEEYKIGSVKLVKLSIRREAVTCEFFIPNSNFKNYIAPNKAKVKQRSTLLRVVDEFTLKTAKDTIDFVERVTNEDAEQKKLLAKEHRKAKK